MVTKVATFFINTEMGDLTKKKGEDRLGVKKMHRLVFPEAHFLLF